MHEDDVKPCRFENGGLCLGPMDLSFLDDISVTSPNKSLVLTTAVCNVM